jgi:hypothetical protein
MGPQRRTRRRKTTGSVSELASKREEMTLMCGVPPGMNPSTEKVVVM